MALQEINIGASPNDGSGDPLRTAMDKINETVARAPGCPQKTFIIKCGSEPLSQEGNPMFSPGEYRPDPSAGITAPKDLPQPEIVPYSRNDIRNACPRRSIYHSL